MCRRCRWSTPERLNYGESRTDLGLIGQFVIRIVGLFIFLIVGAVSFTLGVLGSALFRKTSRL